MKPRFLIAVLLLTLAASPALAEVSDKIPSTQVLWGWAIGFNLAAVLLSLWRPALGLAVVPVAAFQAWAGHEMISDPDIGPAILQEQGAGYFTQAYASGAVGVIGPLLIAGLLTALRRRTLPAEAA